MSNTNTETKGNAPTYLAYQVSKGGQKSYWTRIGVAFPHNDGKGFNILLESVPVDGKITIRVASENK